MKKNILFLLSLLVCTVYGNVLPTSFEGFWHTDASQPKTNSIAISGKHVAWDNKIWIIDNVSSPTVGVYSINLKSDNLSTHIKVGIKGQYLSVVSQSQESFNMVNDWVHNQKPENPWPTKTTFDLAGTTTISGKVCDSTLSGMKKLMITYHNEVTHKKEWFTCDIGSDGLFSIKIPMYKPSLVRIQYKERAIEMVATPKTSQILFFKSYDNLWESWNDVKQAPNFAINIDHKKTNDRAFFMGDIQEFNTLFNHFQDISSSIERVLRRDEFGFKDKEEAKKYFKEYEGSVINFIHKVYNPKLDQSFITFAEDYVKFRLAYDLSWKIGKFEPEGLTYEGFEELTSTCFVNTNSGSLQIPYCRNFIDQLFGSLCDKNKQSLYNAQRDSLSAYLALGLIKLNTNDLGLVKESFSYQYSIYPVDGSDLPDSLMDEVAALEELDILLDDLIKYEIINKTKNKVAQKYLWCSVLTRNRLESGIPISPNQFAVFYRKNKEFASPEHNYIKTVNEQQKKIETKFPIFDNKGDRNIKNFKYLKNEAEYRNVIEKNDSRTKLILSLPNDFDEEIVDLTTGMAKRLQAKYPTLSISLFIFRKKRGSREEFLGIQSKYANYLFNNGFLQHTFYICDSVSLWYEWSNRLNQATTFRVYKSNGEEVKAVLPHDYKPEEDFYEVVEELVSSALSSTSIHKSQDLDEVPNSWRLMYSGDGVSNYVFSQWKNAKNIDKDMELYLAQDRTYQIEKLIPTEERGIFSKQLEEEGQYNIDAETRVLSLIPNSQGKPRRYRIVSSGPESLIMRQLK